MLMENMGQQEQGKVRHEWRRSISTVETWLKLTTECVHLFLMYMLFIFSEQQKFTFVRQKQTQSKQQEKQNQHAVRTAQE